MYKQSLGATSTFLFRFLVSGRLLAATSAPNNERDMEDPLLEDIRLEAIGLEVTELLCIQLS